MLFTNAVVAFLSVTVVSASPIQRRSAATVLADITVISSDIATLQTGVNAYTGTIAVCRLFDSPLNKTAILTRVFFFKKNCQ